jgi:hypothetical protein
VQRARARVHCGWRAGAFTEVVAVFEGELQRRGEEQERLHACDQARERANVLRAPQAECMPCTEQRSGLLCVLAHLANPTTLRNS